MVWPSSSPAIAREPAPIANTSIRIRPSVLKVSLRR